MRLRVVVLVYLALFVGELSWSGVTPLIPSYIDAVRPDRLSGRSGSVGRQLRNPGGIAPGELHHTPRQSAHTHAHLHGDHRCRRPGHGRRTRATGGSWRARLIFGLGFGTLWVSMAAWLADAAGEHSARVLALTTSIVGLGATLSPAYAGWVADQYGLSAPFVGLAVVTGVLFVLLLLDRSGTGLRKDPAPPTRELATRRALRSRAGDDAAAHHGVQLSSG